MKTIGLEEHFITPELFGYSASTKNVAGPGAWEDETRRLTDFLELRIPEMGTTAVSTSRCSPRGVERGMLRCMPDYSLFGDEHVRRYEATGGKIGHDWNGASCLILRTRGRQSGETRKIPLIYGRDGDNYVVVASKGGAPEHPGWYKNLLAHPDVEIQVWDQVVPVTARTGTAADKKRVWPIMTAQWPGYNDYQAGTKRDIPVVLLKPR